jgi:hypothetical protein
MDRIIFLAVAASKCKHEIFDGIFMILSYSLDVRQLPLGNLFFQFLCFHIQIIIYDLFSLSNNPDLGTEFIPNTLRLLGKWRIF